MADIVDSGNLGGVLERAVDALGGLPRLTPTWVRSGPDTFDSLPAVGNYK